MSGVLHAEALVKPSFIKLEVLQKHKQIIDPVTEIFFRVLLVQLLSKIYSIFQEQPRGDVFTSAMIFSAHSLCKSMGHFGRARNESEEKRNSQ